jgi:hypothetical protein
MMNSSIFQKLKTKKPPYQEAFKYLFGHANDTDDNGTPSLSHPIAIGPSGM